MKELVEFHGRKVRWVEVKCLSCENLIFNEDDEIFSLKCKISNVKMDFDTAMKKRKIICDSYKASS